jgi:hypothetical protein
MKDPIILWPKISPEEVMRDCAEWVEKHGGLADKNGEPNLMAAAGADPGCCSCPSCHEYHWSYGIIHKCPSCGLVYPTDWWCMFAWGSHAGRRDAKGDLDEMDKRHQAADKKRRGHPYWEYGYKHCFVEPWVEKSKIDFAKEIGDCYISGGEFRPVMDYSKKCGVETKSPNSHLHTRP